MGNLAERQLSDLLARGTRPTAAGGASSGERQGHPQKRTILASKESSSPTLALSDGGSPTGPRNPRGHLLETGHVEIAGDVYQKDRA